jgi:hypothetical protein
VKQFKFKFSTSELKLLIGVHVGGGDYQWYPCSLDESLGFIADFGRELRKMLHMFGRKELKHGVNLLSFESTEDGRVAFITFVGGVRVRREVSRSRAGQALWKLRSAIDESKP